MNVLAPWRNTGLSQRMHRAVCALIVLDVAVVATAVAVYALSRSEHASEPWLIGTFGLVLGWSFIGGGLVAMLYTTARRIAWLMATTGLIQILLLARWSDVAWKFTLGTMFNAVVLVLIGYIVLSFPSGRLEGWASKTAVGLGFFTTVLMPFFWMPLASSDKLCLESPQSIDGRCPENVLMVGSGSDQWAQGLADTARILGVIAIGLAIWAITRRWQAGSAAWRHAVAPVAWTGAIMLMFMLVGVVNELVGSPLGEIAGYAFELSATLVPIAFVVGLVRARLERAGVVELMAKLGGTASPEELRQSLVSTLRDPTLEVAFRTEDGSYVDETGRPYELPEPSESRAVTPIAVEDGIRVGALIHDPALGSEPELLESVTGAASLALVNHRLQAELRGRLDELRESRARIVEAGDEARREIERNLHDGTQQRLASIRMSLGLAESRFASDPDAARHIVSEAKTALGEALHELRELSQGVHPGVLTERGLGVAVKELAYASPLPIDIEMDVTERLPEPVEAGAYYVVAEGLANATKHAQPERVSVGIQRDNGVAFVRVCDDGVGGADPAGSGLRGLADRVEALGGEFRIDSPAGAGTILEAELPCGL